MLAAAFTSIALLPGLLTGTVDTVKTQTPLPVLLPSNFYSDFDPLYPYGGGTKKSYDIGVAAAPDCGGATACFAASFTGEKGGTPYGRGKVTLAKGRHGRYQPLGCGASCSPPSISWRQHKAAYVIQANVGTKSTERRILVRMANQAILVGAR